MNTPTTDPIQRARSFLRGRAELSAAEALALGKELTNRQEFGYSRRVLSRARHAEPSGPLATELRQRHALCTSKDLDLPAATRHDLALQILADGEDLQTTKNQETLGIAGGILKRRWEVDGRREHLERSLAYYRTGFRQGLGDYGYTAINTAFVLDLLAALEKSEAAKVGAAAPAANTRHQEADTIRAELVQRLPDLAAASGVDGPSGRWWFEATLAEAHLGLGNHDVALEALRRGQMDKNRQPWEYESTVRQLVTLARIRADDVGGLDPSAFLNSPIGEALKSFLGDTGVEAAASAYVGKLGLALSGGGFRASLFHIGVLAKLAELDLLRRTEVLSCVSGGSIVGVHYYLKVRKLMQDKPDAKIGRADFVQIVTELADEFVEGVGKNLRSRAAANPLTHLRTIAHADHTTRQVGELFEEHLYARVNDGEATERRLHGLFVHPADGPADFHPVRDNWLRRAKVPMLVLNATTLNTGHNWQFTASWMGEPPAGGDNPVDRNDLLRRMYYDQAPAAHKNPRLGHAVAASACVPGLFSPVVLSDLYGAHQGSAVNLTVRLVDGGVHDNQGIASLLEQDCSIMVVSDATGQMETELDPSGAVPWVPLRSSSILMARVRGAQYAELAARVSSSLLRGLAFVHLKKELDLRVLDWIDSDDPYEAEDSLERTTYGIRKDIQAQLARIRTDLDAFSQAESYALMTSGYLMLGKEVESELSDLPVKTDEPVAWRFLAVKPFMTGEKDSAQFRAVLDAASQRFFKLLKLSRWVRAGALAAGLAALAALVWVAWTWRQQTILTVGILGGAVLAFVIASYGTKLFGYRGFREWVVRLGVSLGLAVVGPLVFGYHLLVTNRRYLARGRVHIDENGEVTVGVRKRWRRGS
jgi:predicted acylesterase/phospholipase RssA